MKIVEKIVSSQLYFDYILKTSRIIVIFSCILSSLIDTLSFYKSLLTA